MGGGGRLNQYVAFGYYLDTTEKPSLKALVLVKGSRPHWMSVDAPPRPPRMDRGTGGGCSIGSHFMRYHREVNAVSLNDDIRIPVETDNVFMFVGGDAALELVGTTAIEPEFDFDPLTGTSDDMRWVAQLERAMRGSDVVRAFVESR